MIFGKRKFSSTLVYSGFLNASVCNLWSSLIGTKLLFPTNLANTRGSYPRAQFASKYEAHFQSSHRSVKGGGVPSVQGWALNVMRKGATFLWQTWGLLKLPEAPRLGKKGKDRIKVYPLRTSSGHPTRQVLEPGLRKAHRIPGKKRFFASKMVQIAFQPGQPRQHKLGRFLLRVKLNLL